MNTMSKDRLHRELYNYYVRQGMSLNVASRKADSTLREKGEVKVRHFLEVLAH